MSYADYGSTTRDALCKCLPGYHFESTDQRSCVANSECSKGYGQTEYGMDLENENKRGGGGGGGTPVNPK